MAQSEEVIVISRNCYGGYSPDVKKVFDRAISSSTPFFTYRDGKIYHVKRYKNSPVFTVYMYGEISDFEKQIAGELVRTNSVNMGRRDAKCHFADDISQLRELFA